MIMLSDLDIGMNDWVVPRLRWDDAYRPDRGRVLTPKNWRPFPKFFRYMPEDGTAVAPRTLAGVHPKGAYFTRGSGHNKFGGYTEIPDEYQEVVDRLLRKHQAAADYVPAPVVERHAGAQFGIITIGGCDLAVREAIDYARRFGDCGQLYAASRLSVYPMRSPRSLRITSTAMSSNKTGTLSLLTLITERDSRRS